MTSGDALDVLQGFAHHDDVEVVSTDPADSGWLLQIEEPDVDADFVGVKLTNGDAWTHTGFPYRGLRNVATHQVEPRLAADRIAALVLAHAAASAHADALATLNPHILDPGLAWIRPNNVMSPEQAVALMGLYLRLRGDFTYLQGGNFDDGTRHSATFDRGMFYWLLARSLLPGAWRWFSACVYSSHNTGNEDLLGIGGAALTRFDRVLRARDKIHEQFQIPQTTNTADEAHFYLDTLLLQLVGVFDAIGRVAHLTYGIPGPESRVNWRHSGKGNWRAKLAPRAPTLAAMMDPGTAARDILDIAAILRNTIHGAALQGLTVRAGVRTDHPVLVPASKSEEFVAAIKRRGGLERWGIRPLHMGLYTIATDRFVEALVPDAARAASRLMAATDVSLLAGVTGASLTIRAPRDRNSPFVGWTRRRVQLLGGL